MATQHELQGPTRTDLVVSVGQGTARLACSPAVRGPAIRRVVQMDTAACPHLAGCLRVVCAQP